MTPTIPTEQEIHTALARDTFYGHHPERVVVPAGYTGAAHVDGVPVEIEEDADVPYVVPLDGGRLGFDGLELSTR